MEEYLRIKVEALREFTTGVFNKLGVPVEDAKIAADVLIIADQRGIASHGLQRLKAYTEALKTGAIKPITDMKILKETPNTLFISGGGGLGQVIAYRTMRLVIDKALKNNVAIAVAGDSNHYGIAGYYSMMALEHDLIGISLTNAGVIVVPTHGRNALMGTNPISIAVPAGKERPFVLDMACSTVPVGKLQVYEREGKTMPLSWALDELGNQTHDVSRVLANIAEKKGGLLPLGGAGEESGGHKGYGLCLAVDILSGVLSGGIFGPQLHSKIGTPLHVSHFLGAIKIDAFIEPALFKSRLDEYINILRNSEKAEGQDRIFIHGEKEFEIYEQQKEEVRIYYGVADELRELGKEYGVKTTF